MSHARQVTSNPPTNSAITLENLTAEVSNKIQQTIPPRSGKVINATISGKANVNDTS